MKSSESFELARLRALVWPLLVEMCLGLVVSMACTALAARMSDQAGAAFALASHVFMLLFVVFRLVGAGVTVVVGQHLGARQRAQADRLARSALAAATWAGCALATLALVGAPLLMRLLRAPQEVATLAAPLLQMMAPVLLLDAWNASMVGVLRAHLRNRASLWVTLAMHAVHMALAWPLMHGTDTWAGWGLGGFAVALLASRVLGLGLLVLLWRRGLGLKVRWPDVWRCRWPELRAMAQIGLPGAGENLAWEAAFMVSVAAVGTLGAGALATQAYVLQYNMWVLVSSAALGLAVETVVARLVGARDLRQAHRLVRQAQVAGLTVSLLVSGLMAWAGPWLLGLFTRDAEILRVGTELMWWSILLETGRTFNLIIISALRATGDARYPLRTGVWSMAGVLAGGSWLLGVHAGWGLVGVWLAYAADEWLRGLLMWRRWSRLGWVGQARQAQHRMRRMPAGSSH